MPWLPVVIQVSSGTPDPEAVGLRTLKSYVGLIVPSLPLSTFLLCGFTSSLAAHYFRARNLNTGYAPVIAGTWVDNR